MQKQRSRDTEPEMRVRRLVHAQGLRYRVDALLPLPGVRRRADLLFPTERVAVFISGCFWHGCREHGNPAVRSNSDYWDVKIAANASRDLDTDRRLKDAGWTVVRAWEHEDPEAVAASVRQAVERARRAGTRRSGSAEADLS